MRRSSRDAASVPKLLAQWLSTQLPAGAEPTVTLHSGVDANGMSSETLIFDATWIQGGAEVTRHYVARVAPSADDFPVFAHYELDDQYRAIGLVAELTDVPVPALGFSEPTGDVLGTPFFLMDRVDGVIPPDVLPYNFGDNWLADAEVDQQRALQDSTVEAIAALHAIPDPRTTFDFLDPAVHGLTGETLLDRQVARLQEWYDFAVPDVGRSTMAERGLAWLRANRPQTSDDDAVFCWGDARIGNVIYEQFAPVALLDWEMTTLGPRELDVSWLVFAHQVFESITAVMELPGMPDFLRADDVVATYERASGVRLGDLAWYDVFNGIQWCVVFMRTGARQIHFGEIERPETVEALFHCGPLVQRLLDEVGA